MEIIRSNSKRVLIIEDEPDVLAPLKKIFAPYGEDIQLVKAMTAEEALAELFDDKGQPAVDAVILDIMMPYGSAETQEKLKGEGDKYELDTGLLLLKYLRQKEQKLKRSPLWVSIVTGRCAPKALNELKGLLMETGRLQTKPYNEFVLENDIVLALGLESQVPPILLPDGYHPPQGKENAVES